MTDSSQSFDGGLLNRGEGDTPSFHDGNTDLTVVVQVDTWSSFCLIPRTVEQDLATTSESESNNL